MRVVKNLRTFNDLLSLKIVTVCFFGFCKSNILSSKTEKNDDKKSLERETECSGKKM